MSSKSKKNLYGEPSASLQQAYNEVCFRLGQEIRNEERAIENQQTLKEQQAELEKAYNAARVRENDAAEAKAKHDANTKAAKEKAQAALEGAGQPVTPPDGAQKEAS